MPLRFWQSRISLLCVLAVGVLLHVRTVKSPLVLDDYAQRAMAEGAVTPRRNAFNLYDFVSDTNRAALMDRGAVPWWTDQKLAIRFLRPLSSVFVWLDCRIFGYETFFPHVFSLLFFVAAVLTANALFRAAMPPRAALVATTIFALSPAHVIPLTWLANRCVLLSVALGAAALALYRKWRNEGRRRDALWCGVLAALAAASGEYAWCFAGYVFAIELFRAPESTKRRLVGLLPVAIPFTAYGCLHFALGYGATATGFYHDPLSNPAAFVTGFTRAFSTLTCALWLVLDEGKWAAVPSSLLVSGTGAVLAILFVAVWRLRRCSIEAGTTASYFLVGSALGLVPLAATDPSLRLLAVGALGLSAVVALLIDGAWQSLERRIGEPARAATFLGAGALLVLNIGRAPFVTHQLQERVIASERFADSRLSAIVAQSSKRAYKAVNVIRANYDTTVLWAPFLLRQAAPVHFTVLSQTFETATVVRTGIKSVEMTQEKGPLFPSGPNDLFRVIPPRLGDEVSLSNLRATITKVDEQGMPKSVRFDFARDLDDPESAWIVEAHNGFSEVTLPPLGFGVRLAE